MRVPGGRWALFEALLVESGMRITLPFSKPEMVTIHDTIPSIRFI
jgi:hypothetical protein